jgi:hypothetical protein
MGGERLQICLIYGTIHDHVRSRIEILIQPVRSESSYQDGNIAAVCITVSVKISVPDRIAVNFTPNGPDSRLVMIFEQLRQAAATRCGVGHARTGILRVTRIRGR